MFNSWIEFNGLFNKNKDEKNECNSCGMEDYDLLCKENDEDTDELIAIFVCKGCGIQRKMPYREMETK